MSSEWLDIQSFVSDQEALRAINDLAIAVHLSLSGVRDDSQRQREEAAGQLVRQVLGELERVLQSRDVDDVATGVEPRLQELAQSFESARRDLSREHSVLLTMGPGQAAALLGAKDPPAKRELIRVLDELRELITRHRGSNMMGIFEEF